MGMLKCMPIMFIYYISIYAAKPANIGIEVFVVSTYFGESIMCFHDM